MEFAWIRNTTAHKQFLSFIHCSSEVRSPFLFAVRKIEICIRLFLIKYLHLNWKYKQLDWCAEETTGLFKIQVDNRHLGSFAKINNKSLMRRVRFRRRGEWMQYFFVIWSLSWGILSLFLWLSVDRIPFGFTILNQLNLNSLVMSNLMELNRIGAHSLSPQMPSIALWVR